jgi:uncharacterized protein YjaG (DUF416 family)
MSISFNNSLCVYIIMMYKKLCKNVHIAGHFVYPSLLLQLISELLTTQDTTNVHEETLLHAADKITFFR